MVVVEIQLVHLNVVAILIMHLILREIQQEEFHDGEILLPELNVGLFLLAKLCAAENLSLKFRFPETLAVFRHLKMSLLTETIAHPSYRFRRNQFALQYRDFENSIVLFLQHQLPFLLELKMVAGKEKVL